MFKKIHVSHLLNSTQDAASQVLLTCQCQLDDFENYELSLLLIFVERE